MAASHNNMADAKFVCDLCGNEEKSVSHRCEDCSQWICMDCHKIHLKSTCSMYHKTIPITELPDSIKHKVEVSAESIYFTTKRKCLIECRKKY